MLVRCSHCNGENECSSFVEKIKCVWCGREFSNSEYAEHIHPKLDKKGLYENLCKKEVDAKYQYEFRELGESFRSLGDYKDSKEHARFCSENCEELVQQAAYEQAKMAMSANNHFDNQIAIAKLKQLGSYKDSENLLHSCEERIPQLEKAAMKRRKRKEQAIYGIVVGLNIIGILLLIGFMFCERYMKEAHTEEWWIFKSTQYTYWGSYWSEIIMKPQYAWIIPVFLISAFLIILHTYFLIRNIFVLKTENVFLSGITILLAQILLIKTYIPPAGYSEITGDIYPFWAASILICLSANILYFYYSCLVKKTWSKKFLTNNFS